RAATAPQHPARRDVDRGTTARAPRHRKPALPSGAPRAVGRATGAHEPGHAVRLRPRRRDRGALRSRARLCGAAAAAAPGARSGVRAPGVACLRRRAGRVRIGSLRAPNMLAYHLRPIHTRSIAAAGRTLIALLVVITCRGDQGPEAPIERVADARPSFSTVPGAVTLVGAGNIARCDR